MPLMSNDNAGTSLDGIYRLEGAKTVSVYSNFLSINLFMLGIYTMVYFGTLYIYLKSKMSRNPAVISAITALYLLNIVQAAAQWVWTDRFLILTGQSSQAAYIYASTGGSWFYLVSNINGSLLGTIADSLLIWRCYNVWNSSLRVILVPLALLLIGIGAGIANTAKLSSDLSNPAIYKAGESLQIQTSLALFSSFTLTLIATSLILYRIIRVTRKVNMLKRTHDTYKEIVDLVVQSSAVYSLVSLVWAISWVTSPSSTAVSRHISPTGYLTKFIEDLSWILAGMTPTVMVARIAHVHNKGLDREALTAHLSDLEFQAGTRHVTISVPAVDGMPPPARE